MRQIGQLNLAVNARKMSIPVTRDGERKTETNQLHLTFAQRPSGSTEQNYSTGKGLSATTAIAMEHDFCHLPVIQHTSHKKPNSSLKQNSKSIPMLFYQEHSALSFLTRALKSIYIFNK